MEISEYYNASVIGKVAADLGLATVQWDVDGNRSVPEIAGFEERMLRHGSRRGTSIRTRELVKDYKATHGLAPRVKARISLAHQATLDTRPVKAHARSTEAALLSWRGRVRNSGLPHEG